MVLFNPFSFIINFLAAQGFNLPNTGRALITGLFFDIPLETDQTRLLDPADIDDEPFPIPFLTFLIADSYSVGDRCYCHNQLGFSGSDTVIPTPLGDLTAAEICARLGPGPGSIGRPLYNDNQCGNGPFIGTGDELGCPGRVDRGPEGCGVIGPTWNFDGVE